MIGKRNVRALMQIQRIAAIGQENMWLCFGLGQQRLPNNLAAEKRTQCNAEKNLLASAWFDWQSAVKLERSRHVVQQKQTTT